MKNPQMTQEQITNLVANNKLVEALEALSKLSWNDETRYVITILSAELNQLNTDLLMGIVDMDSGNSRLNKVRHKVLQINSLRENRKPETNSEKVEKFIFQSAELFKFEKNSEKDVESVVSIMLGTSDGELITIPPESKNIENIPEFKIIIKAQKKMKNSECVINYSLVNNELYAFVILKEGVSIVRLLSEASLPKLHERLKTFSEVIESEADKLRRNPEYKHGTTLNIEFINSLNDISKILIWPIFEKFSLPNKLYFSFAEFLERVSISALTIENNIDIKTYKNMPFLGVNYQITVLSSLEYWVKYKSHLIPNAFFTQNFASPSKQSPNT